MRERKSASREEAERRRETKIPTTLCTVSAEPDMGLELTNREILTRAKVKSQMFKQLSYPGALIFPSLNV